MTEGGGGGVSVVVRDGESRSHGEGRQGVDKLLKPEERSVDTDQRADRAWLLGVQRKLYQWSREPPISRWLLESRMHNERCTSGSARGHAKPPLVNGGSARMPDSSLTNSPFPLPPAPLPPRPRFVRQTGGWCVQRGAHSGGRGSRCISWSLPDAVLSAVP